MNHDDPLESPSRSQIKREAEALQKLGEELITLPAKQLAQIPLPENTRAAIEHAQHITSHGGLRRQRQYIGRLMRDLDPAPIRAKLEALHGADRISRAHFQDAERWRARLLAGGAAVIKEFLVHHPQADREQLERLVREAAPATDAERAPTRTRELFRYIHGLK